MTNKEWRLRFRNHGLFDAHCCPICGCEETDHHTESSECDYYSSSRCSYCGTLLEIQDNSPLYTVWDELKRVRSKKKALDIIRRFDEGQNKEQEFLPTPWKRIKRKRKEWRRFLKLQKKLENEDCHPIIDKKMVDSICDYYGYPF